MPRRTIAISAIVLLSLAAAGALAQFGGGGFGGGGFGGGRRGRVIDYELPPRDIFPADSFTFCRIEYDSYSGGGRSGQGWQIDYPQADIHLSQRLSQVTTISINHDEQGEVKHVLVRLDDPDLFKYPLAFMSEPGAMELSDAEVEGLRQYLLRGGFLVVDDFHGDNEWDNVAYEIGRAFPPGEFPIVDIPLSHEIFHIVFDIPEFPQVPSIHGYGAYLGSGDTVERGHDYSSGLTAARLRGMYDTSGRLMALFSYNTDLGDGWQQERANPDYFREFSAKKAFPMGINIVVYAMTH